MPTPFLKSSILDLAALLLLTILIALLWLDLRYVQKDISDMESERDLLTLKILEMRKDSEYLKERLEIRMAKVTAYSSTTDQTDATPFITASGTMVRDGVAAANFLPFNTKIRLPEVFGEKIFTVEDRMKRNDLVDIWFPTREEAMRFGVRNLKMEILSD